MKTPIALSLALTLGACKSWDSSPIYENSQLTAKVEICPAQTLSDPLASYQEYIQDISDILTKANPDTFRERHAPERICVVPRESAAIDAAAGFDGSLLVNTGILRAAETDAQFAAVIAHELAHFTLGHARLDIASFVAGHPQYASEYAELEAERRAIPPWDKPQGIPSHDWTLYIEGFRAEVRKQWESARRRESPVALKGLACQSLGRWLPDFEARAKIVSRLPSADFEANLCYHYFATFQSEARSSTQLALWKEIEADATAYAFYLRAGFPEDEYAQFFDNVARIEGTRPRDCDRTEGVRPMDCWRAGRIRAERKAQAPNIPHTLVVHNFGDRLSELRKLWPTLSRPAG